MRITHTYRGNVTVHAHSKIKMAQTNSGLVISEYKWSDVNERVFSTEIEAHELLKVAKSCIDKLNAIAEMNYAIYNGK